LCRNQRKAPLSPTVPGFFFFKIVELAEFRGCLLVIVHFCNTTSSPLFNWFNTSFVTTVPFLSNTDVNLARNFFFASSMSCPTSLVANRIVFFSFFGLHTTNSKGPSEDTPGKSLVFPHRIQIKKKRRTTRCWFLCS